MIELLASETGHLNSRTDAIFEQESVYHLDGIITSDSSPPAVEAIRSGQVEILVVTSIGGDPEAAIAIGDALRGSNVTVEVDSYCLSSCALFVALPAKHLILRDGSVLGFHHSQAALWEIFGRNLPRAQLDWTRLARVAEAEKSAFLRWQLNDWWLYSPIFSIGISCILERFGVGQLSVPRYLSDFTFWMPSPSLLLNLETPVRVPDSAQPLVQRGLSFTIKYGEGVKEYQYELSHTPACQ